MLSIVCVWWTTVLLLALSSSQSLFSPRSPFLWETFHMLQVGPTQLPLKGLSTGTSLERLTTHSQLQDGYKWSLGQLEFSPFSPRKLPLCVRAAKLGRCVWGLRTIVFVKCWHLHIE